MTAKAQPAVMTIQPEPSAFDRFNRTLATTPSPSRINTRVPMNSPRNGDAILFFLSSHLVLEPVKGSANGTLPEAIHFIALRRIELRIPTPIHLPVGAQVICILEESHCQPRSIGGPQR